MWQRFTLYDVRVIGHYLGVLVLFSSLALLVPFVTALACAEWTPATHYLLTIGIALIVGSALRFLRIDPGRLNRQQALAVTGFAWIVLAFVAAVRLYLSGHYLSYLDALFDGVSGLTTTGASVIVDLDHLSNADNMWRFMMHLLGGFGLIVVALSFGLFGKRAGASLYMSEGRSEHVVPNVVQTTQFIAKIGMGMIFVATVILTAMCLFLGMEPLRAFLQSLWLAISGFTTGGFAPMSQSVMYYHWFPLEIVLMLLMLLGSINFVLHSEMWKGHVEVFFRDLEIRTMVLWLAVMTCVLAASLSASPEFSSLPAMLRRGLFMVISAFSTTGFQNITTNELTTALSSGAFFVLAILMAVGGSGGLEVQPHGHHHEVHHRHHQRGACARFGARRGVVQPCGPAHSFTGSREGGHDGVRAVRGHVRGGHAGGHRAWLRGAAGHFRIGGHGQQRRRVVGACRSGHVSVVGALLHRADVGRSSGIRYPVGPGGGDHRVAQSEKAGAKVMRWGTRQPLPLPIAFVSFVAVLAVLLAAVFALPAAAHADEPAEGDNAVNTQQLPDSSFIYDTSIVDLSGADAYYDNQTVQVTGEVIGDSIRAGVSGRHRWITLSSQGDSATISVYMSNESASKIDTFGEYGTTGTILQVRGTFHLVCADHEGQSDLHAEAVTVIAPGERHPDEFDFNAFVPGIVVVVVGLVMLGVFYWLRERQR